MASFEVGSDTAWFEGRRLLVEAARDMPEWQVRKHRRPQIRFRDRLYFPSERTEHKRGRVRFVLEPWPEHSTDLPGPRVDYDESYVRTRDREARKALAGAGLGPLLVLATPAMGLLPSTVKTWIHAKLGVDSESATRVSVTVEAGIIILLLFLWAVSGLANVASALLGGEPLMGGTLMLLLFIVVLGLDWAFRWGAVFRGTGFHPGFYEWLWGPILARLLGRPGRGPSR